MKKSILFGTAVFAASALISTLSLAKPENIKAGIPYYSDEYITIDNRYELAEEKNFEEVYKNYNYYEAVYDKQERIVIFNAFKKGLIEFSEVYYYDSGARPVKKEVTNAAGEKKIINLMRQEK